MRIKCSRKRGGEIIKKQTIIIVLVLCLIEAVVFAHDGHKKLPDSATVIQQQDTLVHKADNRDAYIEYQNQSEYHPEEKVTAELQDFPNLHPLIVHFPIVLLIIAAFLATMNILFMKKEIDWIVTITVLIGFVGAYIAGKWLHPHTQGISDHAKLVLEQHDFWANWTIYLSFVALIEQLISHFLLKQKRWMIVVVALTLISSAYVISRTGHYGAQLVHIEGIGPQGKYLLGD
ncbi:MAG: hypothetical protein AABY84_09545 [Candidatus Firestonebacteria bacterium]